MELDLIDHTVGDVASSSTEQNIVELESVLVDFSILGDNAVVSPVIESEVSLDLLNHRGFLICVCRVSVENERYGSCSAGEVAPELSCLDVRVAKQFGLTQLQFYEFRLSLCKLINAPFLCVKAYESGRIECRIHEFRCVDASVFDLHRRVLEVPVSRDRRSIYGGGHVGFGVGEHESDVLDGPSFIGELRFIAEFEDRVALTGLDSGYLGVGCFDREIRFIESDVYPQLAG